jgi:hypothetical protein
MNKSHFLGLFSTILIVPIIALYFIIAIYHMPTINEQFLQRLKLICNCHSHNIFITTHNVVCENKNKRIIYSTQLDLREAEILYVYNQNTEEKCNEVTSF